MWLKMKPHEQLEEYHRKLEAAAVAAGFEPHQFPSLQMHVTLARVKPNRAELGRNAIASVDGLTQQCSGFITPAKAGFFQKGMWGEEKAFRVDYATPELNRDI